MDRGSMGAVRQRTIQDYNGIIAKLASDYNVELPIPSYAEYSDRGPNGQHQTALAEARLINVLTRIIGALAEEVKTLRSDLEYVETKEHDALDALAHEVRAFDHSKCTAKFCKANNREVES
jgi:hypothetical protein